VNSRFLLPLCMAVITASACAPKEPPVDPNLQVAMDMVQAWNDQDWERMYELFAEDGVLHSMMLDPVQGRENIRSRLDRLTPGIDQIELQVRNAGVVGNTVMLERADDFVFNGKHGRVPVVGIMEIADGHVQEWREYYDLASLEEALKPDAPPEEAMLALAEEEIRALTAQMQTDWNGGDMAAYLDAYWKDDRLSLLFGGSAVRGWQALSDLFSGSWTTEEQMGDFRVNEMEVRFPQPNIAIASGGFEHQFPAEKITGAFTHVWRHFDDGRWLIVHEHTSRAPTP